MGKLTVETVVISLLFAGMLLYLCAPLVRIASAPQVTVAEEYALHRHFTLHGIIVRKELPIPLPKGDAVVVAADGQAVAAGSTIAICGDDPVTAPIAGIYLRETDGFEHLTADMLSELTPDGITQLQGYFVADTPFMGKIIGGTGWLLAALADTECTNELQEGQSIRLTVQTDSPFEVTATVLHISTEDRGKCAVVFRCIDRLQQTCHLRQLTVSLPDSHLEGLRIPTETVHTDEAGSFVYTLSASKAEKIYITILSEEDDFTIVAKDRSANALRAGDQIIISAPT